MSRSTPICLANALAAGALAVGTLHAQVTRHLMPATNPANIDCATPATLDNNSVTYVQGNDGTGKEGSTYFADGSSRPDYDKIKIYVADPATEVIYFGATTQFGGTVEYRFLDPDGNVVYLGEVADTPADSGFIADDGIAAYLGPNQLGQTCGYDAVAIYPARAGAYTLEFRHVTADQGKYVLHPVDLTVAGATGAIDGRVYARRWHLTTDSPTNGNYSDFFTYTPDSVVVSFDLNGIRPWGFAVNFNRFGADNTGDLIEDRRSNASEDAPGEYPVFLADPDPAVWPDPRPLSFDIADFETCRTGDIYCIYVEANRETQYNVYLDLDAVAGYQPNGRDVAFPYSTLAPGRSCLPWDGRDNYGVEVPDGSSGTVIVEALAGLTHLPIWDAENHPNGYLAEIARPAGLPAPELYWDNAKLLGATSSGAVTELDGCTPAPGAGCNAWTGSNDENINTWLAAVAATESRAFTLAGVCDRDRDGIADDLDRDDDNDGLADVQEGLLTTTVDIERYGQTLGAATASDAARVIGQPDAYTAEFDAAQLSEITMARTIPAGVDFAVVYATANNAHVLRVEAFDADAGSWVLLADLTKNRNAGLTATAVAMDPGFSSDLIRLTAQSGNDFAVDGLVYAESVSQSTAPDTDGDGIADPYDLDADGNGLPDLGEAGGTDVDGDGRVDGLNPDGTIPASRDSDGDGWVDAFDDAGGTYTSGTPLPVLDLDGDGAVDVLDLDDDNDGITDLVEVGGVDGDGDGRLDDPADADADGLADAVDPHYDAVGGTSVTGTPLLSTAPDGDGDDLPDGPCATCDPDSDGIASRRDLDADGDGIPDVLEANQLDADRDGLADDAATTSPAFADADGDGLTDDLTVAAAAVVSGAGGQVFAQAADRDGDGLPNWLDLDADADGIVDNSEAFATAAYLAPGTASSPDGLRGAYDATPASHGGNTTEPVDTDGDGRPDYLDTDSDADGAPDAVEGHDTDGNGVVDGADAPFANSGLPGSADADGDGLADGFDNDATAADARNSRSTLAGEPARYARFDAGQPDLDWRTLGLNVTGFVWDDANANGQLDGLEVGIAGASVELLSGGSVVGTATTGSDGGYRFVRQPEGTDYAVRFAQPAGYGDMSAQDVGWSDDVDSDADPATRTTPPLTLAAGTALPPVGAGFQAEEAPLPVVLAAFAAGAEGCAVRVAWTTVSEVDVATYRVERRAASGDWEEVAALPATGPDVYVVRDESPGAEVHYYRLRSRDFDGTTSLSDVVAARAECGGGAVLHAFPNPTDGPLRVLGLDAAVDELELVDQLGRRHLLPVARGQVDLSGLAAGAYVLRGPDGRWVRVSVR